MKTIYTTIAAVLVVFGAYAQNRDLQYFRPNDQRGLNVFETSKETDVEFDGVKVRVGGDFALQFQAIDHENSLSGFDLEEMDNNINLPTANLNLDAQLLDGLRVHLRTYLSSKHHREAWVKGGYLQMDNLDFISEGFLNGLMDIAFIKVGYDDINYGDAHFRRSDNATAMYNPFVGNYIMDSFTTEPFFEVTVMPSDLLFVAGITNGRLNQSVAGNADDGMGMYLKAGYDSQISDDLRLRITGSLYNTGDGTRDYLYGGDRAGGRYYGILAIDLPSGSSPPPGGTDSDFDPRYNPRFAYQTAFQINPFVKFKGLEFFGIYEIVNNGDDAVGGGFNQLGLEALYRFGAEEKVYLGGRYNMISGYASDSEESGGEEREINRLNIGGGWFISPNALLKLEYVTQEYVGSPWDGGRFQEGKFSGLVIEAVLGF